MRGQAHGLAHTSAPHACRVRPSSGTSTTRASLSRILLWAELTGCSCCLSMSTLSPVPKDSRGGCWPSGSLPYTRLRVILTRAPAVVRGMDVYMCVHVCVHVCVCTCVCVCVSVCACVCARVSNMHRVAASMCTCKCALHLWLFVHVRACYVCAPSAWTTDHVSCLLAMR